MYKQGEREKGMVKAMNEMKKDSIVSEQGEAEMPEEKKDTMKDTVEEKAAAPHGKKKKTAVIAVAVVAVVAAATGLGIYNSPGNRVARLLDSGNQYMEAAGYEEAASAFEQAVAIDGSSLAAYAGGVEAYLGKGVQDEAEAFYERALSMLDGMDTESLAQDMDSAAAVYLAADRVYADNPERALEILETGYEKTGENGEIQKKLTVDYQAIARKKVEDGLRDDALAVYDRLLELNAADQETIRELAVCLDDYMNALMNQGDYDRIRGLAEQYGTVEKEVDFDGILAEIDRQEKLRAENAAFMQKIFDLMASEDYEAMCGVDGSEEARAFADKIEGDSYIFLPDGGMTGFGVGVYIFNGDGYYFYYGEYVEGEREGKGTDFMEYSDSSYYLFTGTWKDDKPNGTGKSTWVNKEYGTTFSEGTLVDGLWDGKVTQTEPDEYAGEDFDLSYTAEKGIPTEDKTEEFLAAAGGDSVGEGWYVIAYSRHYYEMYGYMVYQDKYTRMKEGETIGVIGFADRY